MAWEASSLSSTPSCWGASHFPYFFSSSELMFLAYMHCPAYIKEHDHGEQNQGYPTQPVHIKMVQLVRLNMHSPKPHSQVHPLRQQSALISTASPGAPPAMGLMLVMLPSTDRFS